MSSYGEPNVQHKGAVQQIIDARQDALTAVSEVRKHTVSTPHPNLAPTGEPHLSVMATQAVADYLLQLRPYRASSRNWKIDFGSIELPKKLSIDGGNRRAFGETERYLWLCRQPQIPIQNVSDLIGKLNMNVYYSTNKPFDRSSTASDGGYRVSPPSYPGNYKVDRQTFNRVAQGEISPAQVVKNGLTLDESNTEEESYTPAIPRVNNQPGDTSGRDEKLETYKLVFGPDQLLTLVEIADEVAAEVDMLAEIEPPDIGSDGGDAI